MAKLPDGWYAPVEGERLAWMARRMPVNTVVELGTAAGLSASYLLSCTSADVFCVDRWPDERVLAEFWNFLAARGWADRVRIIQNSTADAAKRWQDPIGLLHIDASHTYEHALSDYRSWAPYVLPGGWIAFHDSQWPEVRQVIRDEVIPSKQWGKPTVTQSLWTAQRG